ncbi:cyanophycin synthetase [Limnobacter humi]|uniref:Cyanophycin synthetase n=1 Tax=Limnobacter humi TaxID=1778671 RepID=A0ABT1WEQ2_9BURK|nr:cyanophycin synthetase [Limnobacter humi]MCQ8895874.1 cyanophycin synthetase [Limnobacter humi]
MNIERIRALRGPNLWSKNTSIEALVFCEENERLLDRFASIEARVRTAIPGIGALRATGLELSNLALAHILGKVALRLQVEAGSPVTFFHVADNLNSGYFRVVVQYEEEELGRAAMDEAFALIQAELKGEHFDTAASIAKLKDLYEDVKLGPSTGSIINAAIRRGIPVRRLTQGSLAQLGWGSKARRIQAAETDSTSAISEAIAQDKDLTKQILAAAGVPVPRGFLCPTFEEALDAFRKLNRKDINKGVVVKPSDGNQGKGVTVNILDEDHLRIAWDAAKPYGSGIPMVEEFIPGHDYRFLVVGGKLVAAARREPPNVIGDGKHTIAELIALENKNPLRGEGHGSALSKLRLDDIAKARIAKQGFTADSIPEAGTRVVLRNNANLSTGGTATDVTDNVHPELAQMVIQAAQLIGIDVCGVDVVCQRVDESLEAQGGGIVELNAAPGLRMHLEPSIGKGRDVGQAMIDFMFAPGETGRIPIVAVTGTNGKTTTVRLIEQILRYHNLRVGFTGTEGVIVNGHLVDTGDCSGPRSALKVLMHPEADAAVLECARGGMLREGLGFDMCDVGIVTNIGEGDHLGLNFIDSVEDLALLKSVLVQNVKPGGLSVLNADDKHTVAMAKLTPGRVLFFTSNPENTVVAAHKAKGMPVIVHDGRVVHVSHDGLEENIDLADVPLTNHGLFTFQVHNVMCAIGAALGLNVPFETIRAALATFQSTPDTVPGRFNFFDHKGASIIADYGHNPDAIASLVNTLKNVPASQRTVVISAAGDRRDVDIIEQGRIVGGFFDHIILYEDACQRGRPDGETLALLQQGIAQADATTPPNVMELRGEFNAIQTALDKASSGSLVLVLIDQVNEALDYLKQHTIPAKRAA